MTKEQADIAQVLGPDYDGVPFPKLLEDLAIYHSSVTDSIKNLNSLKQKVESHREVFKDPNEFLCFLDSYAPLLSDFQDDLGRVRKELYAGVKERHLDTIDQIVERYGIERERVRDFIKDLFAKGINDDTTIILEIVDEMRAVLYVQFIDVRTCLARLNRRLRTFLRAKPQELETRDKHKRMLIPFPAKPGMTWDKVTICFLSSNAVELKVGEDRRGNLYTEIGFEDMRTGKYIMGWFILAALGLLNRSLKKNHTRLPHELSSGPLLTKQIQSLNDLLDTIFEIEGQGRAIVFDRKQRCYRANIHVVLNEPEIFEDIRDSFKVAALPKGTPEDVREMKSPRET